MSEQSNLSAGHDTPVIAAIDIGSNSFHLIIARIVEGTLQPLSKQKLPVQLASGLDHHNKLSDEAIARGIAALKSFSFALSGFTDKSVRIIATYTLRKASNSRQFLQAAETFLDYPIEVVSGEEEARLIFDGVSHTTADSGRKLVIDIGGGSTELIIGEQFDADDVRSINMGCVTFTKAHFANQAITQTAMDNAYHDAMERLSLCTDAFNQRHWAKAIGCSGTNKAIQQLIVKLHSDKDSISRTDLTALSEFLIGRNHADNLHDLGLSATRTKTIAAGVAILSAVFDSLNITELTISDAALREGVLYAMDSRLHNMDIRKRSIDGISKRYYVDHAQANRVKATALTLFASLGKSKGSIEDAVLLLSSAALVHEVGLHIHTRGYHNHSAYIIQHSDLPGFSQQQQDKLVCLVKHCRKRFGNNSTDSQEQLSLAQLFSLCCVLRLSVILNQKRQDKLLPSMSLSIEQQQIRLTLPPGWLDDKSVIESSLQRENTYLNKQGYSLVIVYSSEVL